MAPSRPHLRLLVLLLLLLVYHLESSAAPATRNPVICTCLDYGFDERRPDFKNTPLQELVSDEQLIGFDVDMRQAILRDRMNQPYTLRVLSGYGEVHVRTRTGECDVGWSPVSFWALGPCCCCHSRPCLPCAYVLYNHY